MLLPFELIFPSRILAAEKQCSKNQRQNDIELADVLIYSTFYTVAIVRENGCRRIVSEHL